MQFFTVFAASGLTLIYMRGRYIESKYALEDIELVDLSGDSNYSERSKDKGEPEHPEF